MRSPSASRGAARILPGADQRADLPWPARGPSSSCRRSARAQHVEALERGLDAGRVFAAELVVVDRRVQRADELEDRAERARRVQILLHRLDELRFGRSHLRRDICMRPGGRHAIEPIRKICETAQRLLGLIHRIPAEFHLLAVVSDQQIPARDGR